MPKREKVPATRRLAAPGQVGEIIARIAPLITYTSEEVEKITKDRATGKHFVQKMRRALDEFRFSGLVTPEVAGTLGRWQKVYQKLFGRVPDLTTVRVPEKPEGFGPMRLIVVAEEIVEWTGGQPLQGTQEALKKHFPCWQYADNLDEVVVKTDRDPKNGSYALWVKDVREADEENTNKSADDLAGANHFGITLLERQLLEADYFFEHGEHLDIDNWTLCSGSRGRGGCVPHADWRDGGFRVSWYNPTNRHPSLRARSVST